MQVGCDRLADELAWIKQHQQRHSALVRVLDAKWLRACSSSRSRAAEDSYLMGPGALMPPASISTRDLGVMQGHREASKGAWDGESLAAYDIPQDLTRTLPAQRLCRCGIDT